MIKRRKKVAFKLKCVRQVKKWAKITKHIKKVDSELRQKNNTLVLELQKERMKSSSLSSEVNSLCFENYKLLAGIVSNRTNKSVVVDEIKKVEVYVRDVATVLLQTSNYLAEIQTSCNVIKSQISSNLEDLQLSDGRNAVGSPVSTRQVQRRRLRLNQNTSKSLKDNLDAIAEVSNENSLSSSQVSPNPQQITVEGFRYERKCKKGIRHLLSTRPGKSNRKSLKSSDNKSNSPLEEIVSENSDESKLDGVDEIINGGAINAPDSEAPETCSEGDNSDIRNSQESNAINPISHASGSSSCLSAFSEKSERYSDVKSRHLSSEESDESNRSCNSAIDDESNESGSSDNDDESNKRYNLEKDDESNKRYNLEKDDESNKSCNSDEGNESGNSDGSNESGNSAVVGEIVKKHLSDSVNKRSINPSLFLCESNENNERGGKRCGRSLKSSSGLNFLAENNKTTDLSSLSFVTIRRGTNSHLNISETVSFRKNDLNSSDTTPKRKTHLKPETSNIPVTDTEDGRSTLGSSSTITYRRGYKARNNFTFFSDPDWSVSKRKTSDLECTIKAVEEEKENNETVVPKCQNNETIVSNSKNNETVEPKSKKKKGRKPKKANPTYNDENLLNNTYQLFIDGNSPNTGKKSGKKNLDLTSTPLDSVRPSAKKRHPLETIASSTRISANESKLSKTSYRFSPCDSLPLSPILDCPKLQLSEGTSSFNCSNTINNDSSGNLRPRRNAAKKVNYKEPPLSVKMRRN